MKDDALGESKSFVWEKASGITIIMRPLILDVLFNDPEEVTKII